MFAFYFKWLLFVEEMCYPSSKYVSKKTSVVVLSNDVLHASKLTLRPPARCAWFARRPRVEGDARGL